MVDNVKTPLSQFVIEEDRSAFDMDNIPPPPKAQQKFRMRPLHGSQTEFTEFYKQREEEAKENHFDTQITYLLNCFAKQYLREYIKLNIKTTVYDTIDKELNRKSFTSAPQYYHLKKKDVKSSPRHPQPSQNMSAEIAQSEGFQPVYSLRIASSRTEIGADKNEYTAYVIVGSRISPFDSKLTVCVKRFVELRTFASEIERRMYSNGKEFALEHEFPFHHRLFGNIDKKKLEERRTRINAYLSDVCADENAVRNSYFLSFFDFNDGQYNYIDDDEKLETMERYQEDEFRLRCMEETLEIIGMNGGMLDRDHLDESDSESESTDAEDDTTATTATTANGSSQRTVPASPVPYDLNEDYFLGHQSLETMVHAQDLEITFEVPYDLHHYKNAEYKLIAAVFDILQQQLQAEEQEALEAAAEDAQGQGGAGAGGGGRRTHRTSDSLFLNSYNSSAARPELDHLYDHPHSSGGGGGGGSKKAGHSRKLSGGQIAPAPLRHLRDMSILESTFSSAGPIEFHPSISARSGKEQHIDSSIYASQAAAAGWTASKFLDTFNASMKDLDGGARIIRTASEATSDRSLSYKIPTMVNEVWSKLTAILDIKQKAIPQLLSAVRKELYPVIQEAMTDVAPIIKLLYNSSAVQHMAAAGFGQHEVSADESTMATPNESHAHGKYLSMFGHGYDGDQEMDTSSSDSDTSEIRRSVGVRHFPFVNAMKQYCLTESRLYEFFLAFENLAIDQVFGDLNIIFGDQMRRPNNSSSDESQKQKQKQKQKDVKKRKSRDLNEGISISLKGLRNEQNNNKKAHRKYKSSIDLGDYIPSISGVDGDQLPRYEHIHLLRYNYSILENTSSADFVERIRHIERIHNQINLVLCEIIYAVLKCFMKCLGDIMLYKDQLEEKFIASHGFDSDTISAHEDALSNILREAGYNISFIVDDLKQKIKSEFKDYSSAIFNPLLEGIATIGEISLNCICLMISQFVFDEGEFPSDLARFREAFLSVWFEPIDYYLADFTECVFYILYQSAIGLVHSASQDLLQSRIFNNASAAASHSSSLWFQILRGHKLKQVKKFIPKSLSKNIAVKDLLDLVIDRTLTNIVDETLIYIKLECEKAFFKKFEKREQRLFNDDL